MGKRYSFSGKRSRNKQEGDSSGFDMSNFGFFGGVTSGVRCDADDNTIFCQFTKFTSIISQLIFLISVLAIIYFIGKIYILPMVYGKGRQQGGRK